jgi:hypothetical protein
MASGAIQQPEDDKEGAERVVGCIVSVAWKYIFVSTKHLASNKAHIAAGQVLVLPKANTARLYCPLRNQPPHGFGYGASDGGGIALLLQTFDMKRNSHFSSIG